ncbi:hypothetical protein AAVH_24155 [Aphelenchoides avenae]|nr:hypothetical protein AAVH_24155 [Aphelenchus avenae]
MARFRHIVGRSWRWLKAEWTTSCTAEFWCMVVKRLAIFTIFFTIFCIILFAIMVLWSEIFMAGIRHYLIEGRATCANQDASAKDAWIWVQAYDDDPVKPHYFSDNYTTSGQDFEIKGYASDWISKNPEIYVNFTYYCGSAKPKRMKVCTKPTQQVQNASIPPFNFWVIDLGEVALEERPDDKSCHR